MGCQKEKGSYPSSDGQNTIVYHKWEPEGEIRAVLQLSHGMCEYVKRYDEFACMMVEAGIAVWGNDHLGHGDSAVSPEDYGYFGPRDGWKHMVEDLRQMTEIIRRNHPDKPIFLLAHSMGSFLGRAYLGRYGDRLAGAVIMGTSGGNPMLPVSVPVATALIAIRGERYRSWFMNRIAFGAYNIKIEQKRTSHDWLTRDEQLVSLFEKDPRCNFIFTAAGFRDLFSMLKFVSRRRWAGEVPKELPVLLASGERDPVGSYGKGVKQVYERLRQAGVNQVEVKLFPECRHELLNERNRQNVYRYILDWMEHFL